jgi:hypothetical protein
MKELEIFQTGDIEKNKSFQLNTNNPTNNINIANTLKIGKNLRFQNSYKNVSKTRGVLDGRRRSSYFTNYSGHPQRRVTESETFEFPSASKEPLNHDDDFFKLKKCIEESSLDTFIEILSNQETKWFLEYNDLDYYLFYHAIKFCKNEFITEMQKLNYELNKNMLLMETYEEYIKKESNEKDKINLTLYEIKEPLEKENYLFLINKCYGIDPDSCLVEFYFLLMAHLFDEAINLLEMSYAENIKFILNEKFIGDENNLLEQIFKEPDIAKSVICTSLKRGLDGIAYSIYKFSGIFLDEDILECAIEGECSIFLADIWENSKNFYGLNNNYSVKIGFYKYLVIMLKHQKYKMIIEAIRNWHEAYKEENIFELLSKYNENLAM